MVTVQAISKGNYGNHSSSNYGAHTQRISIGDLTLWFSYETVVAFRAPGHLRRVCENVWSTTTGKHLNWIDGGNKAERLPSEEFDKELAAVLKKHKLSVS